MGTSKSSQATAFSNAINAEIRSLMGRRGISQTTLATATGISQSKISKTVWNDEGSLAINQLEAICEALGVSPIEIIGIAERAVQAAEREEALRPNLDVQTGYDLAAQKKRQLRPGEEAGIEYFD